MIWQIINQSLTTLNEQNETTRGLEIRKDFDAVINDSNVSKVIPHSKRISFELQ